MGYRLLTSGDGNPKTAKRGRAETPVLNAVLHLAPAKLSGYEVCQFRTAGCTAACLNTAGRGGIPQPGRTDGHLNAIQAARVRRTKLFFEDRDKFTDDLRHDLNRLRDRANAQGAVCAVRLNGTSDLPWHMMPWGMQPGKLYTIMDAFPDVQFYDYTKRPFNPADLPDNYHLTFSYSGSNTRDCNDVLFRGGNVAVVFHPTVPPFYSHPVIDGDQDDFRFLDPPGHIVGLKAKGKAKKDTTGFVVHV